MVELMLVLLFIGSIGFWIEAQQTEKELRNVLDEDNEYTYPRPKS